MPIIVVYGGQFGDEGKGKVSEYIANKYEAKAVIRVGGSQADHASLNGTVYNVLPTSAGKRISVLPIGSYIEPYRLKKELKGIPKKMVLIDDFAGIITYEDFLEAFNSGRKDKISSHGLGVRSAVERRNDRKKMIDGMFAYQIPWLKPYLADTITWLHSELNRGEYIIIEGTQGYGLSNHLEDMQPYTTSRKITPEAFLRESYISESYVEERIMCLRSFPIRVFGNSGPLPKEISWDKVTEESGSDIFIIETPKNTGNTHRVARFDSEIVLRAIQETKPTKIVLNMIDYVDIECKNGILTKKSIEFIRNIEQKIHKKIDFVGYSKSELLEIPAA
jgi:adenylosuccinate synthase